jgi:hypothetical protein
MDGLLVILKPVKMHETMRIVSFLRFHGGIIAGRNKHRKNCV